MNVDSPRSSLPLGKLQVGIEHLKHALVAKFTGGRPPIQELRQSFLSTWKPEGKCSIGAWDAKHILIVLESEADARKVLSHPMRKLGHSLFRIFRWTKDFSTKREPTTTTAWIRLASLPPELNNPGYIEAIVASFGRYLAVDNRTRLFTNPNYARACIELDTTKEMPDEVWVVTGAESGFWQKIVYENKTEYCIKCKLHGHSINDCRKHKRRQEEEAKIWEAHYEHGLPIVPETCDGPITAKPHEAAPKLLPDETKLPKEGQTTHADNQDAEWRVVRKRKGRKGKTHHQQARSSQQAPATNGNPEVAAEKLGKEAVPAAGESLVTAPYVNNVTTVPLEASNQLAGPTASQAIPTNENNTLSTAQTAKRG
ncbi:hypothetical protein QQ045_024044 [Rhodiola kirilowii]